MPEQLEQLEVPPGVTNTHCKSASFEYVSFKPGQDIPENAVQVNDKFIGVVTEISIDKHGVERSKNILLCEIIAHNDHLKWEIRIIGHESVLGRRLNNHIDFKV